MLKGADSGPSLRLQIQNLDAVADFKVIVVAGLLLFLLRTHPLAPAGVNLVADPRRAEPPSLRGNGRSRSPSVAGYVVDFNYVHRMVSSPRNGIDLAVHSNRLEIVPIGRHWCFFDPHSHVLLLMRLVAVRLTFLGKIGQAATSSNNRPSPRTAQLSRYPSLFIMEPSPKG